jgi:hypothetical protein
MKRGYLIGLVLLCGCDRAAENAEREYEIASGADRCAVAHRAAGEWLKRHDEKKYQEWKSRASMDCLRIR